jgi:hypothetical protein
MHISLTFAIIFCIIFKVCSQQEIHIEKIACSGDLWKAFHYDIDAASASHVHVLSGLSYILNADSCQAVTLHKRAKLLNASTIPSLAKV